MKILTNFWLVLILRFIVGGVFVYAGWIKIQNPLAFADSVASFQIMPPALVNIFAISLPFFEIMAGGLLIVGWKYRPGAFSVLILCGIFALALGQALVRGLQVDCGCFGGGALSAWRTWISFGRDLLLMAASLIIYRRFVVESEHNRFNQVESKKKLPSQDSCAPKEWENLT